MSTNEENITKVCNENYVVDSNLKTEGLKNKELQPVIQTLPKPRPPLMPIELNANKTVNSKKIESYSEPVSSKPLSCVISSNDSLSTMKFDNDSFDKFLESLELEKFPELKEEDKGSLEKLFPVLEKEGMLSQKVLNVYKNNSHIISVNMTPSYAGSLNEIGLERESKFNPNGCTIPFFTGFKNLKVLDLTNVKIRDNELRYLIRLDKLVALGMSGTAITTRGIKYLSKYATFKSSLKCLKLCFIPELESSMLNFIPLFKILEELDILGTKISLDSVLLFIQSLHENNRFKKLRLPNSEKSRMQDEIDKIKSEKLDDKKFLSELSLKQELKLYSGIYPDIYLGLSTKKLQDKLSELRKRKECIFILNKLCGS